MAVADISTNFQIYVEDASECFHFLYAYGTDHNFIMLASEFYDTPSSFKMTGAQTYSFYADTSGNYDLPYLVESNFETRDKFKMQYSNVLSNTGLISDLFVYHTIGCNSSKVIRLEESSIEILYSVLSCGDGILSSGEQCDDGNN